LAALQYEEVEWEADGLQSVYCIRHIVANFNKKFKNHELKKYTSLYCILTIYCIGNKNILSFTILSLHRKWHLGSTGYHYKSGLKPTMGVVDLET